MRPGAKAPVAGAALGSAPNWQRTLGALWLAQTLTIIGFSLRTPFLPFFVAELGARNLETQVLWAGAINAGGAAVMAITAPLWGALADRYGRKLMVLRAMVAGSLTIGLMALATSPWQLFVLRLVEGGFTGTVTASTTLAASTVPRERLGFGLGLMQMAVFSGSAVGPLIGGVLADQIGYRATFVLAGSLLLVSALLVAFLVEERFEPPPRRAGHGETGGETWQLLLAPALLGIVVSLFALRAASMALQPIVPLLVAQLARGSSAVNSLAGLAMGVSGMTSAVASVGLGRLSDRIGQRPLLIASGALAAATFLPLGLTTQVWQVIVLQALFGIASGGILPTANALVARLTPEGRRGTIYGFTTTASSLGAFVGPLVGTALAAALGLHAPFLVIGLALAVTVAWVARTLSPLERAERRAVLESGRD
ncbi:MFS transporter [Thermomicrobium roseum]|uniref:Major facilitator superfamily MFS_1 n=1 Tax=Thermomicrobium roseum (strain ATCC 27502 / DSM 5159 / P-2) TaxID=309801 RepID=B9L4H7_THERP|nr:MFS transporter [Thermomicrobium roseum]ACM06738.1 major facilitator superfamily MFS_1 [Thermomicrobium roseum DSM 5159]